MIQKILAELLKGLRGKNGMIVFMILVLVLGMFLIRIIPFLIKIALFALIGYFVYRLISGNSQKRIE